MATNYRIVTDVNSQVKIPRWKKGMTDAEKKEYNDYWNKKSPPENTLPNKYFTNNELSGTEFDTEENKKKARRMRSKPVKKGKDIIDFVTPFKRWDEEQRK